MIVFSRFWSPHSVWSSWAGDLISARAATHRILNPPGWAKDWTWVPALQRRHWLCHSGNSRSGRGGGLFFVLSFVLLGPHPWHMEVPSLGVNRSCSCQPTPQPQPGQSKATCATYTRAHSNAGSLTRWLRPGIKPTTSWFLVRCISAVPPRGLPSTEYILKIILALFSDSWISI